MASHEDTKNHHNLLCVGEFTRNLSKVYQKYKSLLDNKGKDSTISTALSDALSDIGVGVISDSFTRTLLKYLENNFENPTSIGSDGSVSWSEFCVIAAELFAQKEDPQSQLTDDSTIKQHVYSTHQQSIDDTTVFLGGSCNPTVWRKEIAIPMLQKENIHFYNPQVDEWYPELIDVEERAKQDASVLLFVIDTQTRAVSSMVETALLIGAGSRIVVVVKDMDENNSAVICGERLKKKEILDINRGRSFLRELAEMHSVIIEPSVRDGTKTVIDILKQKYSSEELVEKRYVSMKTTKLSPHEQESKEIIDRLKLIKQVLLMCKANKGLIRCRNEVISALQSIRTHSDPLRSSLASALLSCHSSFDSPIQTYVPPTHSHAHASSINSSHTSIFDTPTNTLSDDQSSGNLSQPSSSDPSRQSSGNLSQPPSSDPSRQSSGNLSQPSSSDSSHQSSGNLSQPSSSDPSHQSSGNLSQPSSSDSSHQSSGNLSQPSSSDPSHQSSGNLSQPSSSDPSHQSSGNLSQPPSSDPSHQSSGNLSQPPSSDPSHQSSGNLSQPPSSDPSHQSSGNLSQPPSSDPSHQSSGNLSQPPSSDPSNSVTIDHSSSNSYFDIFCVCYSEFRHRSVQQKRQGLVQSLCSLLWVPLHWMNEWVFMDSSTPHVTMTTVCHSDIFLGGSCGNSKWRDDIVIPLLRSNNINFFNPQTLNWDPVSLPLERKVKEACSMLLYVITGETLSIGSLIEAAYYIGLCKQVVLCVQEIPVDKTGFAAIEGIKLKESSIKDYNRGRSYLRNLAKKSDIPVYSNINDAVMYCICKLKGHHRSSQQTRRGVKRPLSHSSIMTDSD